jgi:hypothetical protein
VIVAQGKEAVEFLAGLICAAGAALERQMADDVQRGIFANVEAGLMRDNGDGTYSLTEKGIAQAKRLLGQ